MTPAQKLQDDFQLEMLEMMKKLTLVQRAKIEAYIATLRVFNKAGGELAEMAMCIVVSELPLERKELSS